MILTYFILFIVINFTSSVYIPDEIYPRGTSAKTFTRKKLNANLGTSGPLFKSSKDTSLESKVINENYFPDVIYPTNILDVAEPFFYKVNAYDEVLGPFSEDVKSSYKYLSSNTKKASKNVTPNYDEEILKNDSQSQMVYNLDIVNTDGDICEISKCDESHDENTSVVSNEDNYYDVNIIQQRMKESEANTILPLLLSPCSNETDLEGGGELIEKIYNETILCDKQECDDITILDTKECTTNNAVYSNFDDDNSLKEKSKSKSDNLEAKVPIEVKIRIEVFNNIPGKQVNRITQDIDSGLHIIVDESINKEKNESFIENCTRLQNTDFIESGLKIFENKFAIINETSYDELIGTPTSSLIESFERENITDDILFSSIEKLSLTTNDSLTDLPMNIDSVLKNNVVDSIFKERNESIIERRTILPNVDLIEPELKLFENKFATINESSFKYLNDTSSSPSIGLFESKNIFDDISFLSIELSSTVNNSEDLSSIISNYNDSNYSASYCEDVSINNATDVYTVPLVIYLKSNTSTDCDYNETYISNINNSSTQDEDFFLDFVVSLDNLCETNDTIEWQDIKNLTDLHVIENSREALSDDSVPEAGFNITLYSVNPSREDD